MSAENLDGNLQNYKVQLQQVEGALVNDPQSEDLLKLKHDLQELIQLTSQLLQPSTSGFQETRPKERGVKRKTFADDFQWKSGDRCMAPWSEDNLYYEAVIDDITEDGQCAVKFVHYGNSDVALLQQLRPVDKNSEYSKSKKQKAHEERESKRQKALKKAQRKKETEQHTENSKQKWQNFLSKTLNKKGCAKSSIFASPDTVNGRVGVGTCGIGGKPMTNYQQECHRPKQKGAPPLPRNLNV